MFYRSVKLRHERKKTIPYMVMSVGKKHNPQ